VLTALERGWIAGAGLDAHSEEPLPADSPFWTARNVLVTPHNGATTPLVRQRSVRIFCRNLRRYALGVRALLVGTSYIDRDARATLARPFLDRLSEILDETMHFARLDGWDVVYLLTMESSRHRRSFSRVGRRLPAHATALGKALLAGQRADEIDRVMPSSLEALTASTISTRKALHADLALTRERGYALDHEENTPGVCCIAMAFQYDAPPIDAFSCSIPAQRFTPDLERKVVDAMEDVRHEIEEICRTADRHGLIWSTAATADFTSSPGGRATDAAAGRPRSTGAARRVPQP
jgi:DNA-binding IclR family transcriptional regulator